MSIDIYEAINAFKASQTGRGTRGTTVEQRRAHNVVRKLWQLWGENEIGFHDLNNTFGDSDEWRVFSDDIRLDNSLNGGIIASASVTLIHEAVHLVESVTYVEEELLCRGLQLLYYPELLPPGVTYYDRRGRRKTAILSVGSAREDSLKEQTKYARRNQLVDYVIGIPEYAEYLESEWVARHGRDWGGVANRLGWTKGKFLKVLGDDHSIPAEHADLIVEILESVSETQWSTVIQAAGGEANIRRATRYAVYDNDYLGRLRIVESRSGAPSLVSE
jgi:hypothetical protein